MNFSPVDRKDPGLTSRLRKDRRASTTPPYNVSYRANAEGGTDGNSITTSGGSGTPFANIHIGVGATAIYSTAAAIHGSLGYLFTAPPDTEVDTASSYVEWNVSGAGKQWFCLYLNPDNQVTGQYGNIGLATGRTVDDNLCWRLSFNADRTMFLINSYGQAVMFTPQLEASIISRIEWYISPYSAQLKFYRKDETVPTYDSGEIVSTFSNSTQVVQFGVTNADFNLSAAIDDIGWSDLNWLGPTQKIIIPASITSPSNLGNILVSTPISFRSIQPSSTFGNAVIAISQTIQVESIESLSVFGITRSSNAIAPNAISNGSVGNPQVTRQLRPSGITSSSQVGNSSAINYKNITFSGIASTEGFGNSGFWSTRTINPAGVPSGAAVGAAVSRCDCTVSPQTIVSSGEFGQAVVAQRVIAQSITSEQRPGPLTVNRAVPFKGVPTQQQLGNPTVTTTRAVISIGVPSELRFGNPSVSATASVTPVGISTGEKYGRILAGRGIQSLSITSSQSFGVFALAVNNVLQSIKSDQKLGAPVVTTTNPVVQKGIPSQVVFGNLSIRTTATVSPKGIPSGSSYGYSSINQALLIKAIISRESVGPARTNLIVFAKGFNDTSVGNPTLTSTRRIAPVGIGSSATVGNHVQSGVTSVTFKGISTNEVFGTPTEATAASPRGIVSGQNVGNPGIGRAGLMKSASSQEKFGLTVVIPGPSNISIKGVNSQQGCGNAEVRAVTAISPKGIKTETSFGNRTNIHPPADVTFVMSLSQEQ